MARQRKYDYIWVLKGNYGMGYEDLVAEEKRSEIRARRKDYQENEPGTPLKVVYRRILRGL
jgi:hypothetical protein